MATKIFVGGFPKITTEDSIRTLFANHGEVESVSISHDKSRLKHPLYAIVKMTNSDQALKAITTINNKELDGRKLSVNQSRLVSSRSV